MQNSKEVKKEVSKIGDLVMVYETEITTVHDPGRKPVTKEVKKTIEYRGEEGHKKLPDDIRKQLDALISGKLQVHPLNDEATRGQFAKDFTLEQNKFRKMHGVSTLKLSKELNKNCKVRAKELALEDEMNPRRSSLYQEVITVILSTDAESYIRAPEIVSRWYSEGKGYKFDAEPINAKAEHFTQMIWKASKEFGIAAAKSSTNKTFLVALYRPPGNIAGEFVKNVLPIGFKA